ncbi:MAG: helix-turn-helix domain-containing protein [Pyrinomonadaceae bacterium]
MKDRDLEQTPAESREEFLTARQLASVLQVSEATVRRLARRGRIPSIRLTPRITRFHLQAVRDALDGRPRPRRSAAEAQAESPQLSFDDLPHHQ